LIKKVVETFHQTHGVHRNFYMKDNFKQVEELKLKYTQPRIFNHMIIQNSDQMKKKSESKQMAQGKTVEAIYQTHGMHGKLDMRENFKIR
jgi:hypothetical protein